MAFAENKATPIKPEDLGLDRTRIDAEDKVQLISEPLDFSKPAKGSEWDAVKSEGINVIRHGSEPPEQDQSSLSKRKRLSLSAKKVLHIGNDANNKPLPSAPTLADAPPTDSHARLVHDPPTKENNKLKDLVHDPVDTVKSKITGQSGHQVASNIAAKEISHGREVELVIAHEDIARARTEKERLLAINNVDEMLAARQDMFVRWTMDRHVTKVRILPRDNVRLRDREEFVVKDENGKENTDWLSYIAHVAQHYAEKYGGEYVGFTDKPPSPTKEILLPSLERLLVASAPIQELFMTIRRIYRWDDRNETLKYFVGYYILWVLNLILPGFLASVIYLILHRKVHPPDIDDLRIDIIRTEDINETALTLAEFIEKEGDQRWLDVLIQRIGPWVLIQLSDLANLMEVLRNFYEWRVPHRTGISVGILALALIAVTFTPLWLLVRATTFALGLVFFGLFPISSRAQDYRLLASPVTWLFWKIPTHGEWAIKALQAEGARHRHPDNPRPDVARFDYHDLDPLGYRGVPNVDGRPDEGFVNPKYAVEKDYDSYKCRSGRLVVTSTGVRFDSGLGRTGHWVLRYQDIRRLEKITRNVQKTVGKDSGDDLRLVAPDGLEHVLVNMEKRDECFSQIVGFSDVTWQIVW